MAYISVQNYYRHTQNTLTRIHTHQWNGGRCCGQRRNTGAEAEPRWRLGGVIGTPLAALNPENHASMATEGGQVF